ncbi:MAG: histidinol dehydrogenase [Pseudomonadota bacterium]|nr:histidinol dehydrogenase [Pseudomonadota bacterium]
MQLTRMNSADPDFRAALKARLSGAGFDGGDELDRRVRTILEQVRQRGDEAVLELTRELDRHPAQSIEALHRSGPEIRQLKTSAEPRALAALESAATRIRAFHAHQRAESWRFTDELGVELGQEVRPLDRVGVYVPGGRAAYPSSVLMNVIPAKVAGVREVVMVTPTPEGIENPLVWAAAAIAGVDRAVTIGGAQAIAALSFGTATIPRVDKIVGPGNRWVASAKRQVFGQVGIDMLAGPSEVLVVSDGSTAPEWIALDLFSQAEHDPDAQCILISPSTEHLDAVQEAVEHLLPQQQRAEVIAQSLRANGLLIATNDIEEAIALVNQVAPEHLELSLADPDAWLPKVRHAGAIFLGAYSSEAIGDYCAGPNHVLPTSGTARFSSPLGVYDFQKRSSVIRVPPEAAAALGTTAATLADLEGLHAHAASARVRFDAEVATGGHDGTDR